MASLSTISDYIKFIRNSLSVSRTYHVCWHVGELYFIQNFRMCIGCVSIPHSTCLTPINHYLSSTYRKINLLGVGIGLVNVLMRVIIIIYRLNIT